MSTVYVGDRYEGFVDHLGNIYRRALPKHEDHCVALVRATGEVTLRNSSTGRVTADGELQDNHGQVLAYLSQDGIVHDSKGWPAGRVYFHDKELIEQSTRKKSAAFIFAGGAALALLYLQWRHAEAVCKASDEVHLRSTIRPQLLDIGRL